MTQADDRMSQSMRQNDTHRADVDVFDQNIKGAVVSLDADEMIDPVAKARTVWGRVGHNLIENIGLDAHTSWTDRLSVHGASETTVILSAPSRFIGTRIETSYGELLRDLWANYDVRDVKIVALGQPQGLNAKRPSRPNSARPNSAHPNPKGFHSSLDAMSTRGSSATPSTSHNAVTSSAQTAETPPCALSPQAPRPHDQTSRERYTFDSFVVGASNELAHAVARKVASERKAQYNPIVFHGQHGMGKTHLLQAIINSCAVNDPTRRVRMITSEQFVASFVSSVRSGTRSEVESFKSSLRNVDLLIIDDAHFIADKPGSQEELLHTLIAMVDEGRQVVIATDRHPHSIAKASERLKSILCSGLPCEIDQADYELRRRILDRLIDGKCVNGHSRLVMPDNARDHLAARVNATPRDLEGAFNQVVARNEFLNRPLTLDAVQDALSHARYSSNSRPTVDKIQKSVVAEFGISIDELLSKRRSRNIARPRQVAMYLCKMMTSRSLPDIGRRFGGRDHTTVMHAVKRIDELRLVEPALNEHIENLIKTLKG